MSQVTFPYTQYKLPSGSITAPDGTYYRPLAQAAISSANGRSTNWIVLLDSGSDTCLLPLHLAIPLDLKLSSVPVAITTGVGGGASPTYFAPVTFDLGGGIRFEAQAGFTPGLGFASFGLLGQEGFFSRYNIEFRHADREFLIETP